jgi:ADP-heptose:LPS heptosyltransferase
VAQALGAVPADRRIALVAEPDLLTVAASLSRCAAFVGNDSGLSHLAAATGIPTVAAFGATDAQRYAPWGGVAVQGAARSLDTLTPEMVAGALRDLLIARTPQKG